MFRKRRIAAITQAAAQHRTRAEQLDREGHFMKANMERKTAERHEKRAEKLNAK